MTTPTSSIPRRICLELLVPAEKAIRDAMLAVEAMPPHVLLTDAVNLLAKARDKVADYVDLSAKNPNESKAAGAADHAREVERAVILDGPNRGKSVWLMEYKSQVIRQYRLHDGTPLFKPEMIGVWNYGRAFVMDHRVGHHLLDRWNQQQPWQYELVKMERLPFGDVVPKGALVWTTVHDYWVVEG